MELIKDMTGEYIYISFDIIPPSALYYKDKKLLKTDSIDKKYLLNLIEKLKLDDTYSRCIVNSLDNVKEVVITSKGIYRFSLGG